MADINLERVKKYNAECNAYRQKLSQIRAERKILTDNINAQCEQLSKQLGVVVNLDNIEQIYQDRASSIENILEAGEGILRRIKNSGEDKKVEGNAGGNIPGAVGSAGGNIPGAVGSAGGNIPGAVGSAGGVQFGTTGETGMNGLPVSSYKMPSNFASGKTEGNNPFIAQSIFSGNMRSIDVVQSNNEECLGVDEI